MIRRGLRAAAAEAGELMALPVFLDLPVLSELRDLLDLPDLPEAAAADPAVAPTLRGRDRRPGAIAMKGAPAALCLSAGRLPP
jgi:hypothetical protein